MTFNSFFKSKIFIGIVVGLAELIVLLLVFRAGMVIGFHKVSYNYKWGENYEHLFGGPGPRGMGMMQPRGFVRDFNQDNFMPSHGVTGSVLKIDGNTLIIKALDNTETSLLISSSTAIQKDKTAIAVSAIHENDHVVAIGSPSTTGQIEVKFLRVFSAQ